MEEVAAPRCRRAIAVMTATAFQERGRWQNAVILGFAILCAYYSGWRFMKVGPYTCPSFCSVADWDRRLLGAIVLVT